MKLDLGGELLGLALAIAILCWLIPPLGQLVGAAFTVAIHWLQAHDPANACLLTK